MNEAINHALATDFYSLNIEKAGVANSYFASVDKKGTKAQQLDLVNLPTSRALGLYEPDQFPRPVMVTVESETSHNIAVVLVCFEDRNFDGFGEWGNIDDGNQPEMEVFGIYANQKDANEAVREIADAYRVLEKTATLVADYAEKRKGGEADNGHAKGAF